MKKEEVIQRLNSGGKDLLTGSGVVEVVAVVIAWSEQL